MNVHPFQSRFRATTGSHVQCLVPANIHTYLHSKKYVCTYKNTNPCLSNTLYLYVLPKSTAKIQLPRHQHSLLGPDLDCDFVGHQLNCRDELKVFLITVYFRWLSTLFQTLTWELRTNQLTSCMTHPRSSSSSV